MSAFQFLSRLIDDEDPVIVMPFGGYANKTHFHGQARVLEDEGIEDEQDEGFMKNLYHSFKRFETDELENAHVLVESGNFNVKLQSDDEGYVYLNHEHGQDISYKETTHWIPLTYKLKIDGDSEFIIKDELMVPSNAASYGIITDMDDTVIDTGLSSTLKWRVIRNSFFRHSNKRIPLEGAQEFYSLLQKGLDGKRDNPFFYLSNSPWNLHEYLQEFLRFHNFPKGILLLRDLDLKKKKKKALIEGNKYVKISHILKTYPEMPFVLIGDAADLDHDIYIAIAREFPERIKAIYIRVVDNKPKMKRVRDLVEKTTDVDVRLIENTDDAIDHARKNGLIT